MPVLTRKTAKNQITLPKAVVTKFRDVDYFEVSTDGEAILLRPFRESRADAVRDHLKKLGITTTDIQDAVAWARKRE